MKRKMPWLNIFFALIIVGNAIIFYSIREDYRNNTYFALSTNAGSENDAEWINENYSFYQLKLENNKLKYDIGLKALWTMDILVFLAIIASLKLKRQNENA
ncbi:MAG: hypothetical protein WC458_02020 [Patescibacteria group bacterium]|jgi:hypothetical protein